MTAPLSLTTELRKELWKRKRADAATDRADVTATEGISQHRTVPQPAAGPVARALGVLADFPGITSVRDVAKKAECDYSTLYKSDRFREAWAAAASSRCSAPSSGHKTTDGDVDTSSC